MPPEQENKPLVWPYWPMQAAHLVVARGRLRAATASSPPRRFDGEDGKVKALKAVRLEWKDGKPS